MNSIRFKKDISFEQYNMVVRILEALDIEVEKDAPKSHGLTEKDLRNIEISHKQAERGEMLSSEEAHKKMWAKYGN